MTPPSIHFIYNPDSIHKKFLSIIFLNMSSSIVTPFLYDTVIYYLYFYNSTFLTYSLFSIHSPE